MKFNVWIVSSFLLLGSYSTAQIGTLISNKIQKNKSEKEANEAEEASTLSADDFWTSPSQNQQTTLEAFLKNNPNPVLYKYEKARSGSKNYGKGYFYVEDIGTSINCDFASNNDYTNGNKIQVCFNPSFKPTFTANHPSSSYFMGTEFLSEKYPGLNVSVAGETGIDIMWRGRDKSQIIQDFEPSLVTFYGDKMEPNGNDYTLSLAVVRGGGVVHQVKGWEDTWKRLKEL